MLVQTRIRCWPRGAGAGRRGSDHGEESPVAEQLGRLSLQFRAIFKNLTCCLADFDGDGMHDILSDEPAFYAIFDPPVGDPHPAADLTRDGQWDSADETLFFQYLSLDCPCGL
jgi:hypothetical protein